MKRMNKLKQQIVFSPLQILGIIIMLRTMQLYPTIEWHWEMVIYFIFAFIFIYAPTKIKEIV